MAQASTAVALLVSTFLLISPGERARVWSAKGWPCCGNCVPAFPGQLGHEVLLTTGLVFCGESGRSGLREYYHLVFK